MRIEEEVFYGYQVKEEKLIPFGFEHKDNSYSKSFPILNGEFTVIVSITDGKVTGKVMDESFGDEYALFRNEKAAGEFIGKVKEEFTEILLKIRKACFSKELFPDPQSVRIAKYILDTYGDKPDFPWPKYPYYGVFRNKENNRWYGLIMNIEDNKLGEGVSARSVINIKPTPGLFNELLSIDNIFVGWHMNKKAWLSVSLSDYFPDEYIESLIDMSYNEVDGLSKVRMFPPKRK